jgi:hypothetical protein
MYSWVYRSINNNDCISTLVRGSRKLEADFTSLSFISIPLDAIKLDLNVKIITYIKILFVLEISVERQSILWSSEKKKIWSPRVTCYEGDCSLWYDAV